jgi:hypothetical protein
VADKTKDAQDTALSALLGLPTLLGIVKAAPSVLDALSNFSDYIGKHTSESVNSLLDSFLAQSPDAPYVRAADTSLMNAAKELRETTERNIIAHKRDTLGISNVTVGKADSRKWWALSRVLVDKQPSGLALIHGKDGAINVGNNGNAALDASRSKVKEYFNTMEQHFPGSANVYQEAGSIRPHAALSFVKAHQKNYGYGPIDQLAMGTYSAEAVEGHMDSIAAELKNVHQAAIKGDRRAQRVMRETYRNLQDSVSNTESRVSSFASDIEVRLNKTNLSKLQTSVDVERWLMQGMDDGSPITGVRRMSSKLAFQTIGQSNVYDHLNDPVSRSHTMFQQISHMRSLLEETKAGMPSGSRAVDEALTKLTAQQTMLRNLQLDVSGITFTNSGLTQQALQFTISAKGKSQRMDLAPISWMVPITTQGYISRNSLSVPEMTILNMPSLYTNMGATDIRDAGSMNMMESSKFFGKFLQDIKDYRITADELRRAVTRNLSKSAAYSVPRTYSGKDSMNMTMMALDDHDFFLGRQTHDSYRRVIEGSKGIDLIRTGGNAILYDTEYGSGLSRRAAKVQDVTRSLSTETYDHGLMLYDVDLGKVIDMPKAGALTAVPKGSQARLSMESWLSQHGLSAGEIKQWKADARLNGSTGDVAMKAISIMAKWEEQYLHKDGVSKQSFFVTQEGPAFDIPILRNTLAANNITDEALEKEFGNLYTRLFAGVSSRHGTADLLKGSYRHANLMSIFRVLHPDKPVAEGAQSMFKHYYGMSVQHLEKAFGMVKSKTRWKDQTIIDRVFGRGKGTDQQIDNLQHIITKLRENKLDQWGGHARGHLGEFDVIQMSFTLDKIKEQIDGLSDYDMKRIHGASKRAESFYKNPIPPWVAGPNYIQGNRDRFDVYNPSTAGGALSISVASVSKTQAARLRGTLWHLEKTLPLGTLHNFGREKYQLAGGRIINPIAASNGTSHLTTIMGYGRLQTTTGGMAMELQTLAQNLGVDAPPELDKLYQQMLADEADGMLNLSKYQSKLNALRSRLGHTSMITVLDYLPEGYAYTEESGDIISEQLLPYLSSYAGESKYTTYYETQFSPEELRTPGGIKKILRKAKFHKGIISAVNDKIAKGIVFDEKNPNEFTIDLLGMHGGFEQHQKFLDANGVAPSTAILADELLVDSSTKGLGELYVTGVKHDHQVPGYPASLTFDTKNNKVSIGLHHFDPATLGLKTYTDDKITKQSLTVISGVTRGYRLDPLVGAAQGGKFGGSRNEVAGSILKQIDRVTLSWMLQDKTMGISEQKRRAYAMYKKILGEETADLITYNKTQLQTPSGLRMVVVPVLPSKAEAAVKSNYSLSKLESILRSEGITYEYVEKRFRENLAALKLPTNPDEAWATAKKDLYNSLQADIDASTAGSQRHRSLSRMQGDIGKPGAAAPRDLIAHAHGLTKSSTFWGLRALGTRSVTSSHADFWMKFSRGETLSGFPNISPRLLGTTANILLQSFDLAANRGGKGVPGNYDILSGFLTAQAGINHVNSWNENAVGDTLLDVDLMRNFYLKGMKMPTSVDIQGMPNPVNVGITKANIYQVRKEIDILGDLQSFIDFNSPDWHSMDNYQRAEFLEGKFGIRPSDDFLLNLRVAKSQREELYSADKRWLRDAKLLKPRGPGGDRFIRYDAPMVSEIAAGFDIQGVSQKGQLKQITRALTANGSDTINVSANGVTTDGLIKRLGNLVDDKGRIQFDFNIEDALRSQFEKLGSHTGGEAAKFKELLGALLKNVDGVSKSKGHFMLPSLGGVLAPYSNGDRVLFSGLMKSYQTTLGMYANLGKMKIDLSAADAANLNQAQITELALDMAVQDIKTNVANVNASVAATASHIMGDMFRQANFRSAAGTTTMAWGKLQSSAALVPALEKLYGDMAGPDFKDTIYKVPSFLDLNDKSPFKLSEWLTNLSAGGRVFAGRGGDTGKDMVLQTKGFGLGESPISYTQATNLVQDLRRNGQLGLKDSQVLDWLRGKSGREMGHNRSPDMVQGQVLMGQLWVQPDELWKAADSLGAPYIKESAVYLDRITMKFVHGDQDGDLAAMLNMGGFLDVKTGKIGPKRNASANLVKGTVNVKDAANDFFIKHTQFLADWDELQRTRDGITSGSDDIYRHGVVSDGTRKLFSLVDPDRSRTLTASITETFPTGLLDDSIQLSDPITQSIQHLTQKSFTPMIGGYVKTALAMTYGGDNSLFNRLGDEIGASTQSRAAFDDMLRTNNLAGNIYGRTLTSGAYLKAMGTLRTVNPGLLNMTTQEIIAGSFQTMLQEGGITKINANPVAGLVNMMSHLRNLRSSGLGSDQFSEAVKYIAFMDGAPEEMQQMSVANQFRTKPMDSYSAKGKQLLRNQAHEAVTAYGVALHGLEAARSLNQEHFLEQIGDGNKSTAEMLDMLHTSGRYMGDMDNKAAYGPLTELQAMVAGDDGFTTAFRSFLTPAMKRAGIGNQSTENVVQSIVVGLGQTETFGTRSASRVMKEYLKDGAGHLFNFIDSSVTRKYSRRFAAVATAISFFDPNTGSMLIGEGEGRGGEYSDIPSGKEVMRAFRNRKKVVERKDNPFLQDKLNRLSLSSPFNTPRTVRGQTVPDAPKYEYNDHKRNFNRFNISDHLRRAGAIMQ